MTWKTVIYASMDIRDGVSHEVYITELEMIETVNVDEKTGKKKKAFQYKGVEKGRGPVKFLVPDGIAKQMGEKKAVEKVFLLRWKGKIPIKGGKSMNVFACEEWTGDLPGWAVEGGQTEFTQDTETEDDFPDPAEDAAADAQAAKEAEQQTT
jgi:hypothetical protein